jgi:hypothetical protein
MASTIRVRATNNGDITEVQALIQHPMDSGFVKDSKGEIIRRISSSSSPSSMTASRCFLPTGAAASPRTPMSSSPSRAARRATTESKLDRQQGRHRFHHAKIG